jgi:iron complex outermembrane receptor protein
MYRYHALGGASLAVLGSALSLVPSAAEAQTALPAVTVEAPRAATARPAARKPAVRSAARTQARPPSVTPAPSASLTSGITPSVARALLNTAPNGQTETTIDRSRFENRPAFSVADILRESPGISIKQGNGPRDMGISIRGSNARNGFAIRNIVIFDDGFPVTQPDGLSRSDLIDPRAYGAIDVIRGPSSALYGNYATGGALNFRTRRAAPSTASNTASTAAVSAISTTICRRQEGRQFRGSLFASDARGDGFIQNSWYNTQTVNFLGTLARHARRSLHGQVHQQQSRHPAADPAVAEPVLSKPVPAGLRVAGVPAAHRLPLQQRLQRSQNADRRAGRAWPRGSPHHRRRPLGARFRQHDDLAQPVRVRRPQHQPADRHTSAIGDFPSYNYMSDVTKRGEIFGMDSTTYFGGWYNTLTASSDTRNVMPGGNATLGLCRAIRSATPPTTAFARARN